MKSWDEMRNAATATMRDLLAKKRNGVKEAACMIDLGVKCFHSRVLRYGRPVAFAKLDSAEIPRIKKSAFTAANHP